MNNFNKLVIANFSTIVLFFVLQRLS